MNWDQREIKAQTSQYITLNIFINVFIHRTVPQSLWEQVSHIKNSAKFELEIIWY